MSSDPVGFDYPVNQIKYHVTFEAGRDNLQDILADLDRIFPRWYERIWQDASDSARRGTNADSLPLGENVHSTVLSYLREQLADHPKRKALLRLAEQLLAEESP